MDFKRLMEEAKANQERKAKVLAKMKERNMQNEIEKQKERERAQAQTQLRKVNLIHHATNHTLRDGKKQSELQVKHKKRPIETNTKLSTHKEHKQHIIQTQHQQKPISTQPNHKPISTQHQQKPISTQSNHKPISTQPNHKPISTQPNHKPISTQPNHKPISTQPNHKPISTQPNHKPISTQPNHKAKIKTEEKNDTNKYTEIKKVEKQELNSKPPSSGDKKSALSFKELMELAKKNVEKKSDKSEENSVLPPPPKITQSELDSFRNKSLEKKRNLEESAKPTDTSKKAKLNKKKSQLPPQQPPKPRPQIQQSDYFRKTFDKSSSSKKPQLQTPRHGPGKVAGSHPEQESSSDEDGFIVSDDEADPNFNVSAFIQDMFRYNKNKYADEDNAGADESMVSSFSQQQFEEKRSARIGMLEDLEDIKREDEVKRKFFLKRKKKKVKRLQN